MGRGTFGVSAQLKSIVKHRILRVGSKGELCTKRMSNLNDLYIMRHAFTLELLFRDHSDCTYVKIFIGLNFF